MRETEKQRPGVREISRSSRSIAKCSSRAVALAPCAGIVPVNMVGDHVPQGLDDCELIKFSNPQNTHFKHSSMVVIRDSATPIDCSVFPPNNHENLHLHEREQHPLSPSLSSSSASLSSSSLSSSSSFSPSDTDSSDPESPLPSDARVQKTGGKANSWLSIGFEVLRSKLLAFASSFGYNGGGIRWRIQCFGSTAWVVAMVVMLWSFYMRGRHRRRSRENLMLVVKEKDEKIDKLLHQIAEMNELLIARHRLVAN